MWGDDSRVWHLCQFIKMVKNKTGIFDLVQGMAIQTKIFKFGKNGINEGDLII